MGRDVHRPDLVVGVGVEQFFAIRTPLRVGPAGGGNLKARCRIGEGYRVNLVPSRFVGVIRYPVSVGRELRVGVVEVVGDQRIRLVISGHGDDPDGSLSLRVGSNVVHQHVLSIRRPASREFDRRIGKYQLFLLRAVGGFFVDGIGSGAIGIENDPLAVR